MVSNTVLLPLFRGDVPTVMSKRASTRNPGGQINPDLLRVEPKALKFIKDIFEAKKVVAAVCHAPWLLIETGIAKGRKMTSFKSIKTDVMNAGGKWEASEVVVDQGVITSRNPGDLEAFSAKIIEEVK
jgi:protease I